MTLANPPNSSLQPLRPTEGGPFPSPSTSLRVSGTFSAETTRARSGREYARTIVTRRGIAFEQLLVLGQACCLLYCNLRSLYGWSRSWFLTAYWVTIAVVITPRLPFDLSGVPVLCKRFDDSASSPEIHGAGYNLRGTDRGFQ